MIYGLLLAVKPKLIWLLVGMLLGMCCPQMLILKGEIFNYEWSVEEVPNTLWNE